MKLRLILFLFIAQCIVGFSQTRDLSFGVNGFIKENILGHDHGRSVIIQPDNKILVAGRTSTSALYSTYHIGLVRYNADGSKDLSFGIDGTVTTALNGNSTNFNDIVLQSDGKIIVVAGHSSKTVIMRYTSDGTIDQTYGTNGVVELPQIGSTMLGSAVLTDTDQLFICQTRRISTQYGTNESKLIKLNQNGGVDTAFGNGGEILIDFGYDNHNIKEFMIVDNTKLLLLGEAGNLDISSNLERNLFLGRLMLDGSPDTTFGANGHITNTFTATNAMAVQADGKIVSVGNYNHSPTGFTGLIGVIRFMPDGSPDLSFGTNGSTYVSITSFADYANDVLIQQNQKILIGGNYSTGTFRGALVRLNTDGSLDNTFDNNGIFQVNSSSGNNVISHMSFQDDSRLVTMGYAISNGDMDYSVGRMIIDDQVSHISIPDTNFEQALINFGYDSNLVPDGQISVSDAHAVTVLNISNQNITDLTGIHGFINLQTLDCSQNILQTLDLSLNFALLELDCSNNQITQLGIGQNSSLIEVNGSNNSLESLNLAQNTALESLDISNNDLEELSVKNGNNTALVDFDTTDNPGLLCIEVDSAILGNIPVGWSKDAVATYSSTCLSLDTEAPTVLTKDITVFVDANGEAVITPLDIDDGSFDNVSDISNLIFNIDIDTFNCSNLGANVVVLTVTDEAGNSASESVVVTVQDNTPPIAITQDIEVYLDGNGTVSILPQHVDDGSSDNCNNITFSLDITTFNCDDIGLNFINLTVTDASGNETVASAQVTVVDNQNPIVYTQNITRDLEGNALITITPDEVNNGTNDNCNFILSIDEDSFSQPGVYIVNLTAEDASANIGSEEAIVTIVDSTLGVDSFIESDIQLYPNPVNEFLYLDATNIADIDSVRIYDVNGKVLIVKNDNLYKIDVTILPSGVFFVLITTQEGQIYTHKLVK